MSATALWRLQEWMPGGIAIRRAARFCEYIMNGFIRHFWQMRTIAKRHKMTDQDFVVFVYLGFCRSGQTRPACIKAALSIRLAQISRTLARLEERGLVARKNYEKDRRIVFVSLTAAGQGLYKSVKLEIGP